MRSLKKLVFGLMLCGAYLSLLGCGGANMALVKGQEKLDLNDQSVGLLSVKISNENKPGYQPELFHAMLHQLLESDKKDSVSVSIKDDPYRTEKDKYNEYLLSFNLKSGRYTLDSLFGKYKIPLLMNAICNVPLNAGFEIKPGKVVYLGKINATIVERTKDDQERAGSLLPLMDQSLAGFSSGTFKVSIDDNYEADIKAYREQYPALRSMNIEKTVISSQTPTVAQK
jgi:hypothetical protein